MIALDLSSSQPIWLQAISITLSILLFASVLVSFSLLLSPWIRSKKTGTIKLASDKPRLNTRREFFSALLLSHVEDDLGEDGKPVDIEVFWRSVRP